MKTMATRKLLFAMGPLAAALLWVGCNGSAADSDAGATGTRGVTRVAAVRVEAPFLYTENLEAKGPEADLIDLTMKKLNAKLTAQGSRPNEYSWAQRDDYGALVSGIASNDVEYAAGVIEITDERRKKVDFSESYYTSSLVLVTPPRPEALTPDQLKGKKVGVRGGSAVQSWVAANHPEAEIVPFPTLNEALLAMRRGQTDAVIDDRCMAAYSLENVVGLSHMEIMPGVLAKQDVGIPVGKGKTLLLESVNEAVAEMKAGPENPFAKTVEECEVQAQRVEKRFSDRMERERKATAPRTLILKAWRQEGSKFDIYRLANLSFTLTNSKAGQRHYTSKINFQGKVGVCSASLPPGTYTLQLPKFGNASMGKVTIKPDDDNRVTYNLVWKANGELSLTVQE